MAPLNGPEFAFADMAGLQAKLLDAVGEAILATDPEGVVIYANPAAERLYGWGSGELLGRSIQDVTITEETTEQAAEIMASLREGSSWSGEFMVRRRDGSRFPAQVTDTPVSVDGALVAIIGISSDITERKAALEQLAASERWFRTLVQNSYDIVAVLDADARLTYANPAGRRILGFAPSEQAGRDMLELVHSDDVERVAQVFASAAARPWVNLPLRARFATAAGGWRILEAVATNCLDDPAVGGMVINARDVTEQEETAQALRERVKELTCLSQVGRLVQQQPDAETLCREVTGLLRSALQVPEAGAVQVQFNGSVESSGPIDHVRLHQEPINAAGKQRGRVAVGYTVAHLELLPEERSLVEAIAGALATRLEREEAAAALAESEARFRRLFENAPDVLYRYRLVPDPGLDYISPAVQRITGFSQDEHINDPMQRSQLIHPDDVGTLTSKLAEGQGGPFLVRFRTRDGAFRCMEHRLTPVYDADGTLIATEGIARDVTERVEAATALESRTGEQSAVAHLGAIAIAGGRVDSLLNEAAGLVRSTLDVDFVAVAQIQHDGLLISAGAGWPDGIVGDAYLPLPAEGAALQAMHTGTPLIMADLGAEPGGVPALFTDHGIVSGAAVLIAGRHEPFGSLGVFSRTGRAFSADHVAFLQAVANVLAAAVARDRAERDVERREREFRTIAERSPDIIVRYDRDLRHLYVNPTVTEKTGIPAEEFLGKTNREVGQQPAALVDLWERTGVQVLETGERASIQFTYPGPDGPLEFESHMIPERDRHGQIASVLVVARDLTERMRVERQRRETLVGIVAAQEDERARIAEDIHDDSIQVMVAAGMRLEALKHQLDDPAALPTIERLEETVRKAISRLRILMFELRPPELDREGLAPALRAYLVTTLDETGLVWELTDDLPRPLPVEARPVLYRIAQEAVHNARKHAAASLLQIMLDEHEHGVRLRVRDDGVGFDPSSVAPGPHHLGTIAMRERAETAGGHLQIDSAPGSGTVVTAWIPHPEEAR